MPRLDLGEYRTPFEVRYRQELQDLINEKPPLNSTDPIHPRTSIPNDLKPSVSNTQPNTANLLAGGLSGAAQLGSTIWGNILGFGREQFQNAHQARQNEKFISHDYRKFAENQELTSQLGNRQLSALEQSNITHQKLQRDIFNATKDSSERYSIPFGSSAPPPNYAHARSGGINTGPYRGR